jgi:hypothetical protein
MHFYVRNNKHTQTQTKVQGLPEQGNKVLDIKNPNYSSFDELQWPEKQTTPRGPNLDTPGRLSGDFTKHKLDKIVAGRDSKKKYPARPCEVHAADKKRNETRYTCKSCVPLHEGPWFVK